LSRGSSAAAGVTTATGSTFDAGGKQAAVQKFQALVVSFVGQLAALMRRTGSHCKEQKAVRSSDAGGWIFATTLHVGPASTALMRGSLWNVVSFARQNFARSISTSCAA
jgi:hypothetical protein